MSKTPYKDTHDRSSSNTDKVEANNQKKTRFQIIYNVLTDPGLGFIVAHVFLAAATGGWAIAISLTYLGLATCLKIIHEVELYQKVQNPFIKHILGNENIPIRIAGMGLIPLSVIAFAGGFWLRGTAFLLFSAGDFLYNTKLSKKIPLDNLCFTLAGCITTYLAGAAFFPMAILGTGFILSTYNVLKKEGNRNLGHPKLWAGSAAAISAALGFMSGKPDQLLPSFAMVAVFYSYYIGMEAKTGDWWGRIKKIFLLHFKPSRPI